MSIIKVTGMRKSPIVTFFGLLIAAFAQVGCAYRVGLAERQIPGGYSLIAVPIFKNLSAEPGAEVLFTNAMIREIERSSLAKVTNKSGAQVVLEGSVQGVTYAATETVAKDLPPGTIQNKTYSVRINASLKLQRVSDQKVIWTGAFEGESTYFAPLVSVTGLNTVNSLYNHSAHQKEIEKLAESMMAEAQDRMTENF